MMITKFLPRNLKRHKNKNNGKVTQYLSINFTVLIQDTLKIFIFNHDVILIY